MMTPESAAIELIRAAKEDVQQPSREVVERACGGLDADELTTVLVLLWAQLPGLYAVFNLSRRDWERRQQATFEALAERFYGPREAIPVDSPTIVAARAVITAARDAFDASKGFTSAVDSATRELERSELVEVCVVLGSMVAMHSRGE